MKLSAWIIFFSTCWNLHAATISDSIYLNRDTIVMGELPVNRCVFNSTSTFNMQNTYLDLDIGDQLDVTIFNLDTIIHEISIANGSVLGSIPAGGNAVYSIPYNSFGTFGIKASDPTGDLLGAMAVVRVGLSNSTSFIWNLWDISDTISHDIGNGIISTIPVDYRPNVYTINGLVYPETTTDILGAVTGNIDDSIYISVVNAGNMVHTLHFHGFHFEFVQVGQRTQVTNWIKDSAPMLPDETTTLLLIPDKEGLYPVHDHNLISVLTTNTYPGGMITVLNIAP